MYMYIESWAICKRTESTYIHEFGDCNFYLNIWHWILE